MIIKFLVLLVLAFVLVLLYCSLVSGKLAGQKELEYWQRKAREEGRSHGKAEEA
jgi:uncharacterized membrane protein (DUF106 family)